MDPLIIIVAVIGGAIVGYAVTRVLGAGSGAAAEKAAEAEATKIVEAARNEGEEIKRAAQVEGKELAFKVKAQVEDEVRERKAKLPKQEEAVANRERQLEKRKRDAQKNEADLEKRERKDRERQDPG